MFAASEMTFHGVFRFDRQRINCISVSIGDDLIYNPGREYLVSFNILDQSDRFQGPNQIRFEIVDNGKSFVEGVWFMLSHDGER